MIEAELAIVRLDIALPDLFAIHGETEELAVAGHDPNMRAVGDGRWGGRVLLPEKLIAAIDLLAPADGAILAVNRDQKNLVGSRAGGTPPASAEGQRSFFGGRAEDRIGPDNGCGRAPARKLRAPED